MVTMRLYFIFRAHYSAGPTPLVGWLKADMLNEVLGLDLDLSNYLMGET